MDSFPHAAQPFYSLFCVWRSARKKANEACSQNGEQRGRLCDRCKFRICPQGGQEKGASNMEVHQKRLHMKGRAPQFPVGKIGKGVFGWIGERGKGPSVANPFPYSWEKRGGGGPCIFHPSENPKSVSGLRERESKRWRERRGGGRLRKREIRCLPPSVSDLTWAAKKNRLKGWRKREGKEKSQRGIRRVSARDPSDSLGCRDFFFWKAIPMRWWPRLVWPSAVGRGITQD